MMLEMSLRAYTANEVARNIENEIAYQREITDEAKNALKA